MEHIELSKGIKQLRAKKGLSQESLAELSGLSLRTIQRIEHGETVPRGDTLKRLAIALQVSPDEIIDWQAVEDNNVIIMLNLSQFGYVVFPLLGIIIPLVIWIIKKDKVKYVDELGRSILNFQISWVIVLFLFYGFMAAKMIFHLAIHISIFQAGAILIGLYVYNGLMIIINTIISQNGKKIFYKPSFSFLHG